MITLPILIVCIVLFAWKEAVDDDGAIDKTNKDGTKFSHYDPDRYIVGMVITMVLVAFSQWKNPTWWAFLYFPITWAVFTISFRFLLNRKRGKHWAYVSVSNRYDSFWMGLSEFLRVGLWPSVETLEWTSRAYSRASTIEDALYDIRKTIHRAGTIAYAFEVLLVLVPSITIYITKTL